MKAKPFSRILLLSLLLCSPGVAEKQSVYSVELTTDLAITGAATVGLFVPYAFANSWITKRQPGPVSDINAFDRGLVGNRNQSALVFSDLLVTAAVVCPVILDAIDLGFESTFWEDFIVYSQAILVSSAVVSITKVAVQRPLPRTYAGDPDLVNSSGGYRSFYSGHTSTAATALSAAAVTLSLRYHSEVWPWIVVAGLTTTVAAARIAGGVHFYTDTIVGAAMGTTIGILVPILHRRKDPASRQSFYIVPQPQGATALWTMRL